MSGLECSEGITMEDLMDEHAIEGMTCSPICKLEIGL